MSFTITNKSGETAALYVTMELVHCCNCGVPFAMPTELKEAFQKDSDKWFHCPNGHRQHYSQSKADRLEKELEKEKQEKEHQRKCRDRAENMYRKSEIERKKVRTRLRNVKKKISEGICPCCDQSFPDLHAHMSSVHPDFTTDSE